MNTTGYSKAKGHWVLAQMGKKVLRPGGKELTHQLVRLLEINTKDHIAEFAPGLGFTASIALKSAPFSYVGIDSNEAAIRYLKQKITGENVEFLEGNAAATSLISASKDKVYGEAMLTMHADHRKSEIIKEAHRILKKGGLYAIHELGLTPDHLGEDIKAIIQKDLALAIKVNARPLTEAEWTTLLENEGFKIRKIERNAMHLLEPSRVIDDEGILNALKIGWNVLTNTEARKRIINMRKTFKKHQQHMNAIVIIAEKI